MTDDAMFEDGMKNCSVIDWYVPKKPFDNAVCFGITWKKRHLIAIGCAVNTWIPGISD